MDQFTKTLKSFRPTHILSDSQPLSYHAIRPTTNAKNIGLDLHTIKAINAHHSSEIPMNVNPICHRLYFCLFIKVLTFYYSANIPHNV